MFGIVISLKNYDFRGSYDHNSIVDPIDQELTKNNHKRLQKNVKESKMIFNKSERAKIPKSQIQGSSDPHTYLSQKSLIFEFLKWSQKS
jgi:hypothetical protein